MYKNTSALIYLHSNHGKTQHKTETSQTKKIRTYMGCYLCSLLLKNYTWNFNKTVSARQEVNNSICNYSLHQSNIYKTHNNNQISLISRIFASTWNGKELCISHISSLVQWIRSQKVLKRTMQPASANGWKRITGASKGSPAVRQQDCSLITRTSHWFKIFVLNESKTRRNYY